MRRFRQRTVSQQAFRSFDCSQGSDHGSIAGFWPDWTAWAAPMLQSAMTLLNWTTPRSQKDTFWGPVTIFLLVAATIVVFTAQG
jgi:hypothetical protein